VISVTFVVLGFLVAEVTQSLVAHDRTPGAASQMSAERSALAWYMEPSGLRERAADGNGLVTASQAAMAHADPGLRSIADLLRAATPGANRDFAKLDTQMRTGDSPTALIAPIRRLLGAGVALRARVGRAPVSSGVAKRARKLTLATLTLVERGERSLLTGIATSKLSYLQHSLSDFKASDRNANRAMTLLACRKDCAAAL
jgi:hypothetical protein